jgi:hypothetical protein
MPDLDWSQCPAVESIPGERSGAWVFKGTRTPVSTVFDILRHDRPACAEFRRSRNDAAAEGLEPHALDAIDRGSASHASSRSSGQQFTIRSAGIAARRACASAISA